MLHWLVFSDFMPIYAKNYKTSFPKLLTKIWFYLVYWVLEGRPSLRNIWFRVTNTSLESWVGRPVSYLHTGAILPKSLARTVKTWLEAVFAYNMRNDRGKKVLSRGSDGESVGLRETRIYLRMASHVYI